MTQHSTLTEHSVRSKPIRKTESKAKELKSLKCNYLNCFDFGRMRSVYVGPHSLQEDADEKICFQDLSNQLPEEFSQLLNPLFDLL